MNAPAILATLVDDDDPGLDALPPIVVRGHVQTVAMALDGWALLVARGAYAAPAADLLDVARGVRNAAVELISIVKALAEIEGADVE